MGTDFGRGSTVSTYFPENDLGKPFTMRPSHEDMQRLGRYATLWNFYQGRHWAHERTDGEENITLNFARLLVNKGAAFLTGKGWTIKDREEPYSREQLEYLERVWRVSNKSIFTYEMAQLGGIFGDGAIAVLPNNAGGAVPKLIPPMFVTPVYHPADRSQLLAAKIEFPLNEDSGLTQRTKKRTLTMWLDSLNIQQYIDGTLISSQPHNLGEVPLVMFRNRPEAGASFGTSDLASIIPINKLINEKSTNISEIIDYYGSPVTVAYGVTIKQMQRGARKMWVIGNKGPKDVKIENLEMKGDLKAANDHLKFLIDTMFMLSEMPKAGFGGDQAISNTSGAALQVLFQPLLEVTRTKQFTYGQALSQVNRLLVKYGIQYGHLSRPSFSTWYELEEYYTTDICWPDPLPMDQLIQTNIIMNRLQMGLITVADALSQLGVANVKQYIDQLMEDRDTGRNIYMAQMLAQLASQIPVSGSPANFGGVARNGATVRQVSDQALGNGPGNVLSQHTA